MGEDDIGLGIWLYVLAEPPVRQRFWLAHRRRQRAEGCTRPRWHWAHKGAGVASCRTIGPSHRHARRPPGAEAGASAHRAGSRALAGSTGFRPRAAWKDQTLRTLGPQLPTTDGSELPRTGAQISFPCECDLPWRVAGARLLTASTFPAIKSHGPPQSRPLLDWRWDNRHHPGGAAQASLVRMACRRGRVGLELEQVPTNHDDRSFLGRLKGDR